MKPPPPPKRAQAVTCSPGVAATANARASLGPGRGRYRGKPHVAHGIAPVVDVIRVPKVKPGCLEEEARVKLNPIFPQSSRVPPPSPPNPPTQPG